MKTMLKSCIVISASLLLSGCVHYTWVKPVGDPNTFAADNYNCKQNSINTAPPVFQTYGASRYPYEHERVRTECVERGNREVCKTRISGADYAQQAPSAVDLNSGNRNDLYNACMNARGWVLQAVEDNQ